MVILASMLGSAVAVRLGAPLLLPVMWLALFGSFGWGFLDRGLGDDGNTGYVVCGVVFWLMAIPAVPLIVLGRSFLARLRPGAEAPANATADTTADTIAWLAGYALVGAAGVWLGWTWWTAIAT